MPGTSGLRGSGVWARAACAAPARSKTARHTADRRRKWGWWFIRTSLDEWGGLALAAGFVQELRQFRNRGGFVCIQSCVFLNKGSLFDRIFGKIPRRSPRRVACLAGGYRRVPGPAGAADRGPGGPRSPARQRFRPLPAVHCDAYGGAGGSCGCHHCPGSGRDPRAGVRDAYGHALLASPAFYTPSTDGLPGLLRVDSQFSLIPVAHLSRARSSQSAYPQAEQPKRKKPQCTRVRRVFPPRPGFRSIQPSLGGSLCRSIAAQFFAYFPLSL